ncbi:hypothetical protein JCM8097_008781 [Rhodosporidiobolus ruineniae]
MQAKLATLHERAPCFSFTTPEGRELATTALTHASLSSGRNNSQLAKVGEAMSKAVAIEALFLAPGHHTARHYDSISTCFTKVHLSAIGRSLKLEELMRLDKGTNLVSDSMYAHALEALLGAVHLTHGPVALLQALRDLNIVKAPDVPPEPEEEE